MNTVGSEESRRMVTALEMSGNYRVLRKFKAPDCYGTFAADLRMRRMAVVDTETTGLDKAKDKLFELGYVIVEFDPASGRMGQVLSRYSGTEDPGVPLSAGIKELTGKTDEMLAGTAFDDEFINDEIAQVDLVVCHNAGFDRAFLEKRFPVFEGKWFACSMKEVDWALFGSTSQKLEYLAFVVCKMFYEGHRALVDAEVTAHLLSQAGKDGRTALTQLLESSAQPGFRVWATDAPIEKKDLLKADGFWWNDGSDRLRPVRVWIKETRDLDATLALLRDKVYARNARVTVEHITGQERYTERSRAVDQVSLTVAAPAPGDANRETRAVGRGAPPTPEPGRTGYGRATSTEQPRVGAMQSGSRADTSQATSPKSALRSEGGEQRGRAPAMAGTNDDWELPI